MKKLKLTLITLVICAIVGAGSIGIAKGIEWARYSWTKQSCFTENYVDIRSGYAPTPALYTSIGVIYGGIDRGENARGDEIGRFLAGDHWCGPVHNSNGAVYPNWVYFSEGVVTHHAVVSTPPLTTS